MNAAFTVSQAQNTSGTAVARITLESKVAGTGGAKVTGMETTTTSTSITGGNVAQTGNIESGDDTQPAAWKPITAIDAGQKLDLSKLTVLDASGTTAVAASLIEKNIFEVDGHRFLMVTSDSNFANFAAAGSDVNIIKVAQASESLYENIKSEGGTNKDNVSIVASELTRVTGLKFEAAAQNGPAGSGINVSDLLNMSDTTLQKSGKSLTLQIGDTADAFNKLSVTVGDMHVKALGLSDVDISTQDGAAKSLDLIKDAINTVSDTRGSLGALSNRLDHTINNLGVMRENIQNAESNIRDTDVAEEMMEYTKNSILNQSAQAMLAQANQLPQGVLQLLG